MLICKRNSLLGQAGLEMLQALHPSPHVWHHQWPPSHTTCSKASVHSAMEQQKGCHCVQQLPIYCLTVPSVQSSLESGLNPNTATALPASIMSGNASNNSRQCLDTSSLKASLIQLARKEKLLVLLYKLLSLFYFRDKSLHAVLKSQVQGLFCTALPNKVNRINLI